MFQPDPMVDEVRSQIDHPVLGSDGHFLEFHPMLIEYSDFFKGTRVEDAVAKQVEPA
jgi:hypothetical protein